MSAYLDIRVKNGLSFPNSSGLKVMEQYDPSILSVSTSTATRNTQNFMRQKSRTTSRSSRVHIWSSSPGGSSERPR